MHVLLNTVRIKRVKFDILFGKICIVAVFKLSAKLLLFTFV